MSDSPSFFEVAKDIVGGHLVRTPSSTAAVWDARTDEGRQGAAAFFSRLGGPVDKRPIEERRATARRAQVSLCGEAFVLAQEAKGFRAWEQV